MPAWPPSLPCQPISGSFTWAPAPNIVETPNDVGDVISRRRFTGTTIGEQGTLVLTFDQTEILFQFWAVTCAQGALEFVMRSWRDQVERDYKFVGDAPPQFSRQGSRYFVPLSLKYTLVT